MTKLETTCWTMIDQAAVGNSQQQQEFAARYYPVVSAYMIARWRGNRLFDEVEDACQEVFAECFREDGPLARADRDRIGGFRAFLYGIARNVALRVEQRRFSRAQKEKSAEFDFIHADETSLSQAFDRAWALQLIKTAGIQQAELAKHIGPEAVRRVELLRLRFRDEKPIREIARMWGVEADHLHREYKRARKEFLRALQTVVAAENEAASPAEIERRCRELLGMLS